MEETTLELIEPEAKPQTRAVAVLSPSQLIQIAVERGADLAYVEKLMELQERHEANQARRAYNEAFTAFKAEAVKVLKNKAITAGPLDGKRYAELFAVVNAVTPALSAHGLSASWQITKDEKDWIEVTCTLRHSEGHSEAVSMGGPPDVGGAKNAIQARASTVSYLERYTLKAITGLSEQDDDTGGDLRDSEPNALLDAGRDAAMDGMASLTKWWGALSARDRSKMNKEFPALKRAAQEVGP